MIHPLIGMPHGAEWLVILAIVVLVFGAAKLPELARGTGQALRIFKSETKELRDEDERASELPPTHRQETAVDPEARVESQPRPEASLSEQPRTDPPRP